MHEWYFMSNITLKDSYNDNIYVNTEISALFYTARVSCKNLPLFQLQPENQGGAEGIQVSWRNKTP